MNRRDVNKDISKFLLLSYTEEKKKTETGLKQYEDK